MYWWEPVHCWFTGSLVDSLWFVKSVKEKKGNQLTVVRWSPKEKKAWLGTVHCCVHCSCSCSWYAPMRARVCWLVKETNNSLRFASFVVGKERLVPGFHAPRRGVCTRRFIRVLLVCLSGWCSWCSRMALSVGCVAGGLFGVGGFVCCAQQVVARVGSRGGIGRRGAFKMR